MRNRFPEGKIKLRPPIRAEEVEVAAADLPANEIPGPDQNPNEIDKGRPGCHARKGELINATAIGACVPKAVRHFYAVPPD